MALACPRYSWPLSFLNSELLNNYIPGGHCKSGVTCLTTQQNDRSRIEPGPLDLESSVLTTEHFVYYCEFTYGVGPGEIVSSHHLSKTKHLIQTNHQTHGSCKSSSTGKVSPLTPSMRTYICESGYQKSNKRCVTTGWVGNWDFPVEIRKCEVNKENVNYTVEVNFWTGSNLPLNKPFQ